MKRIRMFMKRRDEQQQEQKQTQEQEVVEEVKEGKERSGGLGVEIVRQQEGAPHR